MRAIILLLLFCGSLKAQLLQVTDVTGTRSVEQSTVYRADYDGDGLFDVEDVSDRHTVEAIEIPAKLVSVDTLASNVRLSIEDADRNPVEADPVGNNRWLISKPGRYWVRVTAIDFDANIFDEDSAVVELGEPQPEPKPQPETPDAPLEPSLKVLVVYEASAITREVGDVIASPIIRNYLRDRCLKDAGGPLFRFVDQHSAFRNCSDKFWCDSLEQAEVPWIAISNGVDTFAGPLPSTVTETLELLKRYGG